MSTPSDSVRSEKTARAMKPLYKLLSTTKGLLKGSNTRGMSKVEYDSIIWRMLAINNSTLKPNTSDYYNIRRLQIKEVEVDGNIVSRLVNNDCCGEG